MFSVLQSMIYVLLNDIITRHSELFSSIPRTASCNFVQSIALRSITLVSRKTLIQAIDKRATLRVYVIFTGDETRRRANRDS